MTGLKIQEKEGVYYLEGILDESADLSPLAVDKINKFDPLKLNLRDLTRCNSIGIQGLLKLVASWGDHRFEYHECNQEFVYQVDMLPLLLGENRTGSVESIFLLYECTECEEQESCYVKKQQLKEWAEQDGPPTKTCPCEKQAEMEPEDDVNYHFLETE